MNQDRIDPDALWLALSAELRRRTLARYEALCQRDRCERLDRTVERLAEERGSTFRLTGIHFEYAKGEECL